MTRAAVRLGIVVAAFLAVVPRLRSQGAPSWSPLAPAGDVPRGLFEAPAPPDFILEPHLPLGLFFTAGNPAAGAFDLDRTYSAYRFGGTRVTGAYRRPLDLITSVTPEVSGATWGRVTESFAAAGQVTLDALSASPGSHAQELFPYGSSPLAEADTSTTALRRPSARLEGALAWRVGAWGVGTAVAYEAVDNRTGESRLPRFGHGGFPAVAVGLVRALGPITLGARARYAHGYEQLHIISHGADGTAYDLEGLSDPQTRTISSASPYFRRYLRDATGVQVSAAGQVAGATWVAEAERVTERERQTSLEFTATPPYDRWRADGWRWALAARRDLGSGGEITGRASSLSLDGSSTLASVRGIFYESHESLLTLAADWRVNVADSLWFLAITIETRHHRRMQQDFLSLRTADLDAWEPDWALTVAHGITPRLWWEAGLVSAGHYAAASIPDPDSTGAGYQAYVAPALSLEATQASSTALRFAVRGEIGGGTFVWGALDYSRAHPVNGTVPFGPSLSSRRSVAGFSGGITIGL